MPTKLDNESLRERVTVQIRSMLSRNPSTLANFGIQSACGTKFRSRDAMFTPSWSSCLVCLHHGGLCDMGHWQAASGETVAHASEDHMDPGVCCVTYC